MPTFYKLKIAREESGAANLLEQRQDELERDVQFIRVFGNMYPPVPMDKNFIDLSIHCDWDKEPGFAGAFLFMTTGLKTNMDLEREGWKRMRIRRWST